MLTERTKDTGHVSEVRRRKLQITTVGGLRDPSKNVAKCYLSSHPPKSDGRPPRAQIYSKVSASTKGCFILASVLSYGGMLDLC